MAAKKPADDADILTIRQVAGLLKIHRATVRKLAQRGEIPGWRVGKTWRFSESALVKHFLRRR
jgi:excisionase family DNA binding protein